MFQLLSKVENNGTFAFEFPPKPGHNAFLLNSVKLNQREGYNLNRIYFFLML